MARSVHWIVKWYANGDGKTACGWRLKAGDIFPWSVNGDCHCQKCRRWKAHQACNTEESNES